MIHRVGFACVTYGLGLSTGHTLRLANLSAATLEAAVEKNCADLQATLEWMDGRDLRMLRLASSFIPFASHERMLLDWEGMFAERLGRLGERWAGRGFRFSMHPGQYTVLNSLRPDVVERAVAELASSCRVLDLMGLDAEHKVVVHAGCVCGDKDAALQRLGGVLAGLSPGIRRRLVLENDERLFTFADVVRAAAQAGLPAVFDVHHHTINPCPDVDSWLRQAGALWDCRPKVHLSSRKPDARPGAHDLFIREEDLAALLALLPWDADVMVEAKAKEEAALGVLRMLGRVV